MRIGQLTFHASHNYGSVLQAYALSRQIQIMGHNTEIINLRPRVQKEAYKVINKKGIHFVFSLFLYCQLNRRHNEFERFINTVLPIGRTVYDSTEQLRQIDTCYDAYICGGDQIWNPTCQDFEEAYYLQFLPPNDPSRKISYSPSLGKSVFSAEMLQNIKTWIQCFDYISVRETTGQKILQSLTDKPIQTVCDPVLLLDRSDWEKLAVKPKYKKPYILVYFLENNHGSRDLINFLHQSLHYDVVLLNEYIRDYIKPYHKAYGASPEEFVGLMMNASFIYTNSFHGTLFATLFEKPFLTAIAIDQEHAKNNNDSRKIDYLTRIGLEERMITNERPDKSFLLNMNYSDVRKRIEQFKAESLGYLIQSLS